MVESATAQSADAAVGAAPASSLISGSSPKLSQTPHVILRIFLKWQNISIMPEIDLHFETQQLLQKPQIYHNCNQ